MKHIDNSSQVLYNAIMRIFDISNELRIMTKL